MTLYLSVFVCLSDTNRCSIKTEGRVGLVFGKEASFDLSYTWYYKEIQVSIKVSVLPSGTFPKLRT